MAFDLSRHWRRGALYSNLALGAIALVVFVLRLYFTNGAAPIEFPDSESYQVQMRDGVWGNFFGFSRPFGYPLFLWALGHDYDRMIVAQSALGGLCWAALSLAAASLFRRMPARIAAAVLIGMLGLSLDASMWDILVLSESLGLSLFALLTVLWIVWLSQPQWLWALPAMLLAGLAFASARDQHLYFLLGIFGATACVATLRLRLAFKHAAAISKLRTRSIVASVSLLVAFVALGVELRDSHNVRRPMSRGVQNALMTNVLVEKTPDGKFVPNALFGYFQEHYGLPASAVNSLGKRHWQDIDPALVAWCERDGVASYKNFLATHPAWVWKTYNGEILPFAAIGNYALRGGKDRMAHPALPNAIRKVQRTILGGLFSTRAPHWGAVLMCAILFPSFLYLSYSGKAARWLPLVGVAFFLAFAVLSQTFVSVFGGGAEFWRHALVGVIAFHALAWLIVSAALDFACDRFLGMKAAG